jgi:hypothetical protein
MGDRKTYAVRLRPEVMKATRILSIEKEIALSHVIEEALIEYLKKEGVVVKKPASK